MNSSFQRKAIYLALMAALLVPVALLGRPAAFSPDGREAGGGKLAELRANYKLGQAQLGKIDPTSSAVRYVSLGLHGVAVCILQQKASDYFRQEDWIGFSAALNQLTYLQPYYPKVWTYQAWNVSYNLSSQWDDHREKYFWVIRGFKLLHQGMQYNELEPVFPYDLGWHLSHKLGQSDERREFRRLFAADNQSRRELVPLVGELADGWAEERDSWLYGKRYFRFAQEMVDRRGAVLRSMSPENFHIEIPTAQSKYAEAIETEGVFGDKARSAWHQSELDWIEWGNREFPSEHGFFYRVEELKKSEADLEAALAKLEAVEPGVRDRLLAEKRARLPDDERRALDLPADSRTETEDRLAYRATLATQVTDYEVAEGVKPELREEARRLAAETVKLRLMVVEIKGSRKIYNYDYRLVRSRVEQTEDALIARELFYKALRDVDESPWKARDTYNEAFRRWRTILDKHPAEFTDDETAFDVNQQIRIYREVLKQLDEPFDRSKFILQDLLENEEG